MFANLIGQVTETLTGRTVHGLMPEHPQQQALQWHIDVAQAIHAGDGIRAREASDHIMRHTIAELAPSWESQPRVFVPVARN
jgi:DNA-binding FadR family transcriptional regulator